MLDLTTSSPAASARHCSRGWAPTSHASTSPPDRRVRDSRAPCVPPRRQAHHRPRRRRAAGIAPSFSISSERADLVVADEPLSRTSPDPIGRRARVVVIAQRRRRPGRRGRCPRLRPGAVGGARPTRPGPRPSTEPVPPPGLQASYYVGVHAAVGRSRCAPSRAATRQSTTSR